MAIFNSKVKAPKEEPEEKTITVEEVRSMIEKATAERAAEEKKAADELAGIRAEISKAEEAMKAAVSANDEAAYTAANTKKSFYTGREQLAAKALEEVQRRGPILTETEARKLVKNVYAAVDEERAKYAKRMSKIRDEIKSMQDDYKEYRYGTENKIISAINEASGLNFNLNYGDNISYTLDDVDKAFGTSSAFVGLVEAPSTHGTGPATQSQDVGMMDAANAYVLAAAAFGKQ